VILIATKNKIISTLFIMDFFLGKTKKTRTRRSTKGTKSKTRPGRLNFTTKKGSKVYHKKGHYVRKSHKPYGSFKGTKSKTRRGRLNYTTKKSSKVFHRKGHYVKKSRRPYHLL
jgi:hypothetical protein